MHIHRIQNSLGWKGALETIQSNPAPAHIEQVTQERVRVGLE